jgi:hypothetical protein
MQYSQKTNSLDYNQRPFCYEQHQTSSGYGEKMQCIPSNMVMIDQAQLMELLQAKQILDAQKAAAAKPGFNSALFITPPRMSKENNTQCTSQDTSADYGRVEPMKGQKPTVSFSALPTSQSSSSDKQYFDSQSEHSIEEDSQNQMLDDDLMRIIDDCTENSNNVESFELSKINENSKGSLNKSGSSLDSLIQNFNDKREP